MAVPPDESYDDGSRASLAWTGRRLGLFAVLVAAVATIGRAAS